MISINKFSMNKPKNNRSLELAFGLVELLVVVGVIAIIGAIALPALAGITESADQAIKCRNAQQVASTWNNYVETWRAVNPSVPPNGGNVSKEDVVQALAAGMDVVNNRLGVTNTFRLSGITADGTDLSKLSDASEASGWMISYTQ